jgi:outer membrane receptor protein involved in Fe transport
MGGVINIVSSRPVRRTIELAPQLGWCASSTSPASSANCAAGNRQTPKLDFSGSDRWKTLGVAVDGSLFHADGFPNVAPIERGPIDINADVKYQNVSGRVDYSPADRLNAFFRASYFNENRTNAKIGEVNDTRWTSVNGGVHALLGDGSSLEARLFVDHEKFHSTFLAVTNATTTRNLVRLSVDQHVPTNSVGTAAQWSKPVGTFNLFSAGVDWRWVDGDSNEDSYNAVAGNPVIPNPSPWTNLAPVTIQAILALQRVSGGTQQSTGAFIQDIVTPVSRLNVTLSARVDHWRNYDGHNLETAIIPGTAVNNEPSLDERTDTVASPKAAALYHLSDRITAWASMSSGFRAPTLNELYRQFRQGTTLVLAPVSSPPPFNGQLAPERLVGGEVGLNIAPVRKVTWRTTWFDNRVKNSVLNVTICPGNLVGTACVPSAAAVTQQRQNVGKTRVWGVQTDVDYRLGSVLRVSAGYVYNEAKVTEGGNFPALVGKFLQQVPKHRASLQVVATSPKYATVALGVQYVGRQFDDDLNTRVVPIPTLTAAGYSASTDPGMPGYATVDLTASRTLARNIEVFVGFQNLLDKQYFVGTQPTTLGSPRLVNTGVRVRFSGH